MAKRILIIFSLVFVAVLCSCDVPADIAKEILPEQIDTQISSNPTGEPTWGYSEAVADYLLPIEDYSWEREYSPEYIVIHFTSAVVNHRDDPYNETYLRELFTDNGVSINYIILRDGTVKCYVPEERVAWHAGKGEISGKEKYTNALNRYSIGIEVAAIGSKSDMSVYLTSAEYDAISVDLIGFTNEQYASLKLLVEDLCSRYGIPLDRNRIIGHSEYSETKSDPGELFDWERVVPTNE